MQSLCDILSGTGNLIMEKVLLQFVDIRFSKIVM